MNCQPDLMHSPKLDGGGDDDVALVLLFLRNFLVLWRGRFLILESLMTLIQPALVIRTPGDKKFPAPRPSGVPAEKIPRPWIPRGF